MSLVEVNESKEDKKWPLRVRKGEEVSEGFAYYYVYEIMKIGLVQLQHCQEKLQEHSCITKTKKILHEIYCEFSW